MSRCVRWECSYAGGLAAYVEVDVGAGISREELDALRQAIAEDVLHGDVLIDLYDPAAEIAGGEDE